ncbi:g4292 [Coccomyxa elongata]
MVREVYPSWEQSKAYNNANSTLGPGSYQYLVLADTLFTPPGSTPVGPNLDNSYSKANTIARRSESSVWSIDANNRGTPQWVNPDGSTPTTFQFIQGSSMYMGGDPAAYFAKYPAGGTLTAYNLTFMPGSS